MNNSKSINDDATTSPEVSDNTCINVTTEIIIESTLNTSSDLDSGSIDDMSFQIAKDVQNVSFNVDVNAIERQAFIKKMNQEFKKMG